MSDDQPHCLLSDLISYYACVRACIGAPVCVCVCIINLYPKNSVLGGVRVMRGGNAYE